MKQAGKRAAVYLRVSTDRQTVENQRPEVDRVIAERGLEVVRAYEESESAVKRRPEFDRMLADGKTGAFDVLVVWALDRFGRAAVDAISHYGLYAVVVLVVLGILAFLAHRWWHRRAERREVTLMASAVAEENE